MNSAAFLRQINKLVGERDKLQESLAAIKGQSAAQLALLRLIYAEVGGVSYRQPYDTDSFLPAHIVAQIRKMVGS